MVCCCTCMCSRMWACKEGKCQVCEAPCLDLLLFVVFRLKLHVVQCCVCTYCSWLWLIRHAVVCWQYRILVFIAGGFLGFDIAISGMKCSEISQFLIKPDYAFGKVGCPPRIPPHASCQLLHFCDWEWRMSVWFVLVFAVFFEIELISFIDSKASDDFQGFSEVTSVIRLVISCWNHPHVVAHS